MSAPDYPPLRSGIVPMAPPIQRANVREGSRHSTGLIPHASATNPVTVVAAPGEGQHRLVTTVTVHNADVAGITVFLLMNTGTGASFKIDSAIAVVANGTYSSANNFPNGIPLSGFQFLSVKLLANTTNDVHWIAIWSDTVAR